MNTLIRGLIIYVIVIASVRLMGKRQIGELQPGELVVTMLLSEVASMALQGDNLPLYSSISLIFLFVALEILSSVLSLKFKKYRNMLQGKSVLVIEDGVISEKNLKLIRYSVDDLIENLRLNNVFDISQVQYAYIETNGSVSVLLKPEYRTVTPKDLKLKCENEPLPCLVISDGDIVREEFSVCGMSEEKLHKILMSKGTTRKNILLMTADKSGRFFIIEKDKKGRGKN